MCPSVSLRNIWQSQVQESGRSRSGVPVKWGCEFFVGASFFEHIDLKAHPFSPLPRAAHEKPRQETTTFTSLPHQRSSDILQQVIHLSASSLHSHILIDSIFGLSDIRDRSLFTHQHPVALCTHPKVILKNTFHFSTQNMKQRRQRQ